jgi:hypothetical protein
VDADLHVHLRHGGGDLEIQGLRYGQDEPWLERFQADRRVLAAPGTRDAEPAAEFEARGAETETWTRHARHPPGKSRC